MATLSFYPSVTVTIGSATSKAKCTVTATYTVTNTDTATNLNVSKLVVSTISVTGGNTNSKAEAMNRLRSNLLNLTVKFSFAGATVATRTGVRDDTTYTSFTGTKSVTKTHSAQSKTASFNGVTVSISVPAKTSYAVSYNVNGGTGSIGNSTKWYGETLTLTTSKPVKSGYTFKGWATSTANAGTGTTTTTYTGNAKATFYATWELDYSKPTITNLKVERCDVNGDADDEGAYARVSFDWSIFRSSANRYYGRDGNAPYANNSATCSINVGGQTLTPTLDGASGSYSGVVGNGSFGVDDAYSASVTISDTETVQSAKTTTVNGTLSPTKFPLDFNADGTAMGIFKPAPDDAEGIYLGKDTDVSGNLVASGSITAQNTTPSISITTTTGTLVGANIRRFGNVVQLRLTVRNDASVASGGNVFTGTIATAELRPAIGATGGSFYGAHSIAGTIGVDGTITIRNASSTAVSITGTYTATVSFTYIVD
jgi:uncharacterized repeat protein (TIGR02543 family)